MERKTAPCQEACPAGVDVPRYVRHLREQRFDEALAVVRERIPFPLVCGFACFHPCEAKCGRAQWDAPVAIRMLKRVAAQQGAARADVPGLPPTGKRVAVIGSGPCGLTAGYYLARQGHDTTVFEALPRSGGMLRFGIPAYRLPDGVIDADVLAIEAAGVAIRTGMRVASAEGLLADGFDAVLMATGAWRPAKLGIPGEDAPQVLDGLALLNRVNAGECPELGASVAVIGGGNTAIDAARVARRTGCEVAVLYRRTRAEMPAAPEEIEAALEEGVRIEFLCSPVRIHAGRVECERMALGEPDASGRRRPVAVAGSSHGVAAGSVIVAIGQEVDLPTTAVHRRRNGTATVEGETLATSVDGVFAAGDAVLGPASIIEAIAQGRRAAAAIDSYLGGTGVIDRDGSSEDEAAPAPAPRGSARQPWRVIPIAERLYGFAPVEHAYDAASAAAEAQRCLSCDLRSFEVTVDASACKDCGYCSEACSLDVFGRSDRFNASGYLPAVAQAPQRCIGCLQCLYVCPDFAITVNERAVRPHALQTA